MQFQFHRHSLQYSCWTIEWSRYFQYQ